MKTWGDTALGLLETWGQAGRQLNARARASGRDSTEYQEAVAAFVKATADLQRFTEEYLNSNDGVRIFAKNQSKRLTK